MSVNSHSEQPPEEVPDLKLTPDPISQACAVTSSYKPNFWGNRIEAAIMGPIMEAPASQIGDAYGTIKAHTAQLAESFMRQVQAQEAFEGLFFEKMNHAYGQAQQFMAKDPLEQLVESEVEQGWRTRLADYTQQSLAAPGLSKAVQLLVTPCIRTDLPMGANTVQHGYLMSSNGQYKSKEQSQTAIGATSTQLFPVPMASAPPENIVSLPKEYSSEAQSPADASRMLAAVALHQMHEQFDISTQTTATVVEAVAVVPSISNVGAIASIDMCLRLDYRDYSQSSPAAYLVRLLYNGQPLQEKLFDGISGSRILATNQEALITGMRPTETIPRLSPKPFNRPEEDGTLSLIALPIRKSYAATGLDLGVATRKYATSPISNPVYIQHDPEYPSFMAHVALVASY